MQTVAFKAGDTIIAKGDDGDTVFFIVTGSVEVSIGQGAKARIVGVLNAGEVFGEMCLIEPGPRSATVKAATDVECLATSYEEFIGAIEDHPDRAACSTSFAERRLPADRAGRGDRENGRTRIRSVRRARREEIEVYESD